MNILLLVLLLCLGATGILVILLAIFGFSRYLRNRETMARAEQGLAPSETKNSKPLLLWGILITGLGLVLTLGLYLVGISAANSYPLGLGPWMLGGLIPLFLGLSLLLLHYLTGKG